MRPTTASFRRLDAGFLRTNAAKAIIAVLSAVGLARADDNVWVDPGSTHEWITFGLPNWSLHTQDNFNAWLNSAVDGAFFNGASTGNVYVYTPIALRGLSFNANGYSILQNPNDPNTNPLTLTAGTTGSLTNGEIQVGKAGGIGVTATVNATIAGSVGLNKTYAGTLLLGGQNTYTVNPNLNIADTTINGGTLAVTANGAVLPAGQDVQVNAGPFALAVGTLNYGNGATINNSGAAIGNLILNGGNFRVSGGFGDFYLNQLSSYNSGTVDLTGSNGFYMHFVKPGASNPFVYVTGPTNWFGSGISKILNDSNAPVTIYVATYSTLNNSVILANGANGKGFLLTGDPGTVSTMVLTNPGNTADLTADSTGYLQVSNMAYLGTGSLTLQNTANDFRPGTLRYDGPSVTSTKPIALGQGGGQIYVAATGTNLTLSGVIGESAAGSGLLVTGNGPGSGQTTLTLTANNTYTGPTVIAYNGYLSVPSLANGGVPSPIGASSNSPANLVLGSPNYYGGGTLQITGYGGTIDRGITLSNGYNGYVNTDTIEVANPAGVLVIAGQVTGAGALTKSGPGYLNLTNATNNYAGGTIVTNGFLETQALAALGPGGLALQNGASLIYTGPTAATSKGITLGGGGVVQLAQPDTNLTLGGTIGESAAGSQLVLAGGGAGSPIVTLAGTNTYTGPTLIQGNAVVSIAALTNGGVSGPLGASSNSPANLVLGNPYGGGTLQYTGPTATTDRGLTLNSIIPAYYNGVAPSIEVTNAATNLTVTGQLTGSGGLTKIGPGTLTLTNPTNNYSGGTSVNAGTLVVGGLDGTGVIPAGSNVTVAAGAVFNTTGYIDQSGQLGTVTLTGGTLRTSGNAGFVDLNRLTMSSGSTLDLTNAGGAELSFFNSGAAIMVTGNASCVGPLTTGQTLFNSSGTELPVTIASGATFSSTAGLFSTNYNPANRFRLSGGGALYLTGANPLFPPDASYVTVNQAQLRVDTPKWLQGTDLTLDAGTLQFSGLTATLNNNGLTNRAFTLAAGGGTVEVTNAATTLTISGLITGSGMLTKTGPGTLYLTNKNNSFSGGTNVVAGTLIPLDPVLGTGPVTVGPAGAIQFTGGVWSGTSFALNSGSLAVPAGVSLTLNGATVAGGFMRGAGTFVLTGGTTLSGVMTAPSTTLSQTGPTTYTNFTNGSPLMVAAPTGTTFDLFTNQGSGAITVAASNVVAASDFQTYGVVTLSPGTGAMPTQVTNAGASNLFFNTGSRTFISIPSHAGQFDAGIDLMGHNAVVAGGLFVNNGYVVDSAGLGKATIVADFGSLVKGAGFFQNSVQTVNGGKFQSGNSPGKASFGSFTFGPGGVSNYVFAIDDATGTAGPSPDANGQVSGWGLVNTVQRTLATGTTPGDFAWTADSGHNLTFSLETLLDPTTVGTDIAGPMADFDPTRTYSWPAVRWSGSYSGPTDAAALDAATSFDTTGFANPMAGTFGWSLDAADHTLSLTYTPSAVPEPGTLILTASAICAGFVFRRRNNFTHC